MTSSSKSSRPHSAFSLGNPYFSELFVNGKCSMLRSPKRASHEIICRTFGGWRSGIAIVQITSIVSDNSDDL